MTLETMQAVTRELVKRGLPATCEYPGFIGIGELPNWHTYGDQAEVVSSQLLTAQGECIGGVDSDIPSDSFDVARIADWIQQHYPIRPNCTCGLQQGTENEGYHHPECPEFEAGGDDPEPSHDDTVLCCPDCERPNQFGELCPSCTRERDAEPDDEPYQRGQEIDNAD